jgi:hypothetical protein
MIFVEGLRMLLLQPVEVVRAEEGRRDAEVRGPLLDASIAAAIAW